jgi:uncharacterized protein
MNDDDKAVYSVSRAFTKTIEGHVEHARLLYGPTERHGVTEWAAQIGQGEHGAKRYVSMAIWEISPHSLLGMRSSVALTGPKGEKYVTDFAGQASIDHGYDELIRSAEHLLEQAISAAGSQDQLAVEARLRAATSERDVYAFANPETSGKSRSTEARREVRGHHRETVQRGSKFEIMKDHAGKFRFHLKAANGEIIAASQAYQTKESAKRGIESVKENASSAKVEDLTEAHEDVKQTERS